jgi:hypothetical protein
VRGQSLPVLLLCLFVGFLEQKEFQLGGALHRQAPIGRPGDLLAQDLPGRHLNGQALLVTQVADDEG